jgi:hypothetical protein
MFYYLSQYLLEWSAGDRVGRHVIPAAALSVHHLSQRWGGGDGAGLELVAGAESDRLA